MNRNLIIVITGRKGSGKTWLSYQIIEEHRFTLSDGREVSRVVAFDTVAQYDERQGFEVAHGFEAGGRALLRAGKLEEFRISLRADDTDELLRLMGVVAELEDVLIVVDEAHFYCKPSKLPRELSVLVRLGRHRRISQIYISQRPVEIHRSMTAQADIVCSFYQREPRDIKYLVDAGGGVDAEHVDRLPQYKLIAFGDGMERDDVPMAILAQRAEFKGKKKQLDAFETT